MTVPVRTEVFEPTFVEFLPDVLDAGVLYVSMEYTTVAHLCACGCGSRVVLPLSPAQWSLVFDGVTVSLHPSIGSWQLPCRSHYLIEQNQVRWARTWTEAKIAQGRHRDHEMLQDYLAAETGGRPLLPGAPRQPNVGRLRSYLTRLRR